MQLECYLAVAEILGFSLFYTNFTQAYVHTAEKLHLDILITPWAYFILVAYGVFQILKPVYVLSDSTDYWEEL